MRFLLLFALTLICAPAAAQMTYRCGKQYQDRPCDPTPATVHAPLTAPPSPSNSESLENRQSRYHAEDERKRAYSNYACARYEQEIRNIYDAQDLRGQNMDELNRRARAVEEQRQRAGC